MKEGNERRMRCAEKNFYNFFEDGKIDPLGGWGFVEKGGGEILCVVRECGYSLNMAPIPL